MAPAVIQVGNVGNLIWAVNRLHGDTRVQKDTMNFFQPCQYSSAAACVTSFRNNVSKV